MAHRYEYDGAPMKGSSDCPRFSCHVQQLVAGGALAQQQSLQVLVCSLMFTNARSPPTDDAR
jgi:hypothetical protein